MNTTARTGLVTGSNRGIGAGIALRLAADGADVAINYLEGEAEAEAIAARIRARGRRALLVPADLRDPQALTAMMDQVLQTFHGLDILVNNAGIGIFSPFLETSLQAWTETMDTNLRAAFLCSQIAARAMAARKFGRIVHITSTGSQVAIPQLAHYCASKAGLAMLTKAMAVELGPLGITVNAVGPSTVRTHLNAALLDKGDMEAREAALNPTGRIGAPQDIAAMVAFLVSDEASWVNGQNIIVDGGLTALSPQPPYDASA
ncbi:MAG: 3-oxoacyl-(acyl-carrier-protein) reductase [Chthonomonadaceae bacterium]|nr:3-oxoacyl-(acyl-carrier-protein) reductase [Chthonomonadaceae bacterium]